jgi:hypothetical protein
VTFLENAFTCWVFGCGFLAFCFAVGGLLWVAGKLHDLFCISDNVEEHAEKPNGL